MRYTYKTGNLELWFGHLLVILGLLKLRCNRFEIKYVFTRKQRGMLASIRLYDIPPLRRSTIVSVYQPSSLKKTGRYTILYTTIHIGMYNIVFSLLY